MVTSDWFYHCSCCPGGKIPGFTTLPSSCLLTPASYYSAIFTTLTLFCCVHSVHSNIWNMFPVICCVLSVLGSYWLLTCPVLPFGVVSSSSHAVAQLGLEEESFVLPRMHMIPLSTRWAQRGPDPDEQQMEEDMTSGLDWSHIENLSCFTSVLVPLPVAKLTSIIPSPFLTLYQLAISISHFYSDSSWELLSTSLDCLPYSFLTLFPPQRFPSL